MAQGRITITLTYDIETGSMEQADRLALVLYEKANGFDYYACDREVSINRNWIKSKKMSVRKELED